MENTYQSKLTCPHCQGEIVIERPVPQRRGQLAGKALEQMSDDELKVELINAKSVLYKATKRGASQETIDKNQARVDAAMAEKEKRTPAAAEVVESTDTETTEA